MQKISKRELQEIFDFAHKIYFESSVDNITHQQFIAKCYLKACAKFLGVPISDLEFDERIPYEPADE